MKIKTNSGFQRFQEEKNYGIWFGKLLPLVASMHSCQPQQTIEPSNIEQFEITESTDESPQGSSTDDTNTKSKRKSLFVPIHETAKRKKTISEDLISDIHETMNDFRDALKNDSTKELIRLLRKDSERQAKNDQMSVQLMQSMIINNNQARKPVFQQTTHSQYPVSMAMNTDFSKERPSYPDTAMFHQQRHGMSGHFIASSPNIAGHPSKEHHGRSFLADLNNPQL